MMFEKPPCDDAGAERTADETGEKLFERQRVLFARPTGA